MNVNDCHTPEALLMVPADMKGYHCRAIDTALDRADAVLLLLSELYDGDEAPALAPAAIAGVICAVRGEIATARKLIEHGQATSVPGESPQGRQA